MVTFKVEGGIKLKGNIVPQGSKNEALQVISAVLLTSKSVRIKNIPEIKDVKILMDILLGLGVKQIKNCKGDYTFTSDIINFSYLKSNDFYINSTSIRGSIMIISPLLFRFKKAYLPIPGGDKIGRRRIDTHLNALSKLGVIYFYNKKQNLFFLEKKNNYLFNNYILLEEASVTATANIIMLSVVTQGETIIYNAACEPYIQQLCKMLNYMGAKIKGIGSNLIKIKGVKKLIGCEHTILPDMVEIGSLMGLSAITNSQIIIKDVSWINLGILPNIFKKMGIFFKNIGDDIHMLSNNYYKINNFIDGSIMTIYDSPWPGLTPDLLSIILVVATQAKGSILIHQKMFESRLFFVDKLIDMGAQIILCDPHRATVIGLNRKIPLRCSIMSSPDIRAGISLLIAALSAHGTSFIHNVEQIDRGYENIDKRLSKLGAKITRIL